MFYNVGYRTTANKAIGFNLIELMVVVAIVAILAAIAIPVYGRYAYRAHRVDGQGLLLRIADAQERFYAANNHYGSLSEIGYAVPALSEQHYYSATVSLSSDPSEGASQVFTAGAVPMGVQLKDACGELTITSSGIKTPAPASPPSEVNGPCW